MTILIFITGCSKKQFEGTRIYEIKLSEPFDNKDHEYSGLAWFGDQLILLPQYPDGHIMSLDRSRITDYLEGLDQNPLVPASIPINDTGLKDQIPGFEGFEAIIFNGNEVYAMLESEDGTDLSGYIIKGEYVSESEGIVLDHASLKRIDTPVDLSNMAYESIVLWKSMLYPIYEANGSVVNPNPRVPVMTRNLEQAGSVVMGSLEYRVTDATEPDEMGKFWVINYMWPGDFDLLKPGRDLFEVRKARKSIKNNIERLVEYQFTDTGIQLTGTPPVWITNHNTETSNNWEGVVRFGSSGFLIITDKYSRTIFAYVERPEK